MLGSDQRYRNLHYIKKQSQILSLYLFVASQANEDSDQMDLDDWLSKIFPKAQVQLTSFHSIIINIVNSSEVLNIITGLVSSNVASSISEKKQKLICK